MPFRFREIRRLAVVLWVAFALAAPQAWGGPRDEFPTQRADQIPWEFTADRFVAVGDLHGEFERFVDILLANHLIDSQGTWIGGTTHLVQMGDINGKGSDTRLIVEMLMRLGVEAEAAGGRVHTLLGNHDLKVLWGDMEATSTGETRGFADYQQTAEAEALRAEGLGRKNSGFLAAMKGDGPIARWIRSRNSMITIQTPGGKYFFGHGSPRKWIMDVPIGAYNTTVRSWVRFFQTGKDRPDNAMKWVISGKNSTAWDVKMLMGDMRPKAVTKIREALGVVMMLFGHRPVPGVRDPDEAAVITEITKGVMLLDTGITNHELGAASALEVRGKVMNVMDNIPSAADTVRVRVNELGRLASRGPCLRVAEGVAFDAVVP